MICNNPIRVKFVLVNVNTVEIRSSKQNVAFQTFNCCFILKWGIQPATLVSRYYNMANYTLDFYVDSNCEKEIYFIGRETVRLHELSTTAIF